MTNIDKPLNAILTDINGKLVLEVACGCAEFSIHAAKTAKAVYCIDIKDNLLSPRIHEYSNITFEQMDATRLQYGNERFDTVVLYNAIGHLDEVMEGAINECIRVVKANGAIHIMSCGKADKRVISQQLIPYMRDHGIPFRAWQEDEYSIISLTR